MSSRLPHQQRCPRPGGPTLHEETVFFLGYSQTLLLFLHFHLVPAYISNIQPLSPLIYLRCPIGLTSYIDKGTPSIPKKYALHMHCIMYLWHVATPYTTRRVDPRNRTHTYQLPIWVLAPEATGHILYLLRFLSPFNCTYGYAFNSKFLFIS